MSQRKHEKLITAPSIHSAGRVRLRVLGTSVTLLDVIRRQASDDLGIDLDFEIMDGAAAQRVGVMRPQAYDIYDQWFNNVDFVWPARAIQPIDVRRIDHWDEVNGLAKTGRITPDTPVGAGSAPADRLYVQPDNRLGPHPTNRISMLPLTHNVDSLGYNTAIVPQGTPYETESWRWLIDERWAGLVALQNDPAIGCIDAALAVSAAGMAEFDDIGNLTVEEIDSLIAILIRKKRRGHFKAFWGTYAEAATLMESGKVGIESMWSPALVSLRRAGTPVRLAAPREGYRAWYGGMSISAHVGGRTLDAAYDYLNWWLSGRAGAIIAAQGYYISVPERTRRYMTPVEWDYWYDGKPAARDLLGPDGDVVVQKGERRDGGSYHERMSRIAVWNSVMNEHNYLVRRWNEFIGA